MKCDSGVIDFQCFNFIRNSQFNLKSKNNQSFLKHLNNTWKNNDIKKPQQIFADYVALQSSSVIASAAPASEEIAQFYKRKR